jgi:hypothetical protein
MVERGNLNRLQQMGSYLAENLRRSRDNSKLLSTIRNLIDISYGGLPLPHEAEEWAKQNNIYPRVRNEISVLTSRLTLMIPDRIWKH